ncbi:MAG TPA: copper-containing nitrite reductase [Candidatus Limnocylindria bacterium]|nr:copper-containing nitrite reductase [Candidatus Limnocylindria bacterium]
MSTQIRTRPSHPATPAFAGWTPLVVALGLTVLVGAMTVSVLGIPAGRGAPSQSAVRTQAPAAATAAPAATHAATQAPAAASAPAASAPAAPAAAATAVEVARKAADVPARITRTAPARVAVTLETTEVTGVLDSGQTYQYWTFGGTVPGPMIRARVGDTVEVTIKNAKGSGNPHSIDLHSVTGPGGGSGASQTMPGGETKFTFKALNPGIYVYHCATAPIPVHVINGMYGLILIEPEGGLPPVDREFYVMQGELYTVQPFGAKGAHTLSVDKMLKEDADYVLFNGKVGALTGEGALKAKVGEKVRIYIGVGGFLASNFHVIGEIFDAVYPEGAIGSEPMRNVQTTIIPPGGASMVEMKLDFPGRYLLVDHALGRALNKGAAGFLEVEGTADPAIFSGGTNAGH